MVATANHWILTHNTTLPAITLPAWLGNMGPITDPHAPWRYTLMSGLIPALPLLLVRPFLPESPAWQESARPAHSGAQALASCSLPTCDARR